MFRGKWRTVRVMTVTNLVIRQGVKLRLIQAPMRLNFSREINHRYDDFKSSESSPPSNSYYRELQQATHHSTRQKILSVFSRQAILHRSWETYSRFNKISIHHCPRHRLQHGIGALASLSQKSQELRVRVDPTRVEHFIDIITSQQIIQDLPFGRRKLKLSNGEILDVPNVIRLLIPTHLVS